jgi:hypothetical protein
MHALIRDMVQTDPSKRPSIDEVVARFTKIRASLGEWTLRSRVVSRREFFLVTLWRLIPHWRRQRQLAAQGLPAIPHAQPAPM